MDRQRGAGIFRKSIETLKKLNCIGYGKDGSRLILNLVYNPAGAFLPPSQKAIEGDYKREMLNRYGITFNNLYTITNMPVGRFLNYLEASENYDTYMQKLINSYNPNAASQVMCRYTLSVGWDGTLYDCDFNQMLGMAVYPHIQESPAFQSGDEVGCRNSSSIKPRSSELALNSIQGRGVTGFTYCQSLKSNFLFILFMVYHA